MKNIITSLLLLASVYASSTSAALQPVEILYSEKGYPYKLLIERADVIKVIYSEEGQNDIQCSVKLVVAGQELHSSKRLTSKTKFNQEPLASCLARDKAKELLAKTFD